jgi:hypothetical protein
LMQHIRVLQEQQQAMQAEIMQLKTQLSRRQ